MSFVYYDFFCFVFVWLNHSTWTLFGFPEYSTFKKNDNYVKVDILKYVIPIWTKKQMDIIIVLVFKFHNQKNNWMIWWKKIKFQQTITLRVKFLVEKKWCLTKRNRIKKFFFRNFFQWKISLRINPHTRTDTQLDTSQVSTSYRWNKTFWKK